MESPIEHVRFLGYPLRENVNYDKVMEEGAKNPLFTEIIAWLSGELQVLCDLESCIHPITGPEDSSSFLLEVSSFLKDMCCPYSSLMEGPVSQRIISMENKALLIQYLCTELEAARMITEQSPPSNTRTMKVEMQESSTAKELKEMLICLNFSKPPPTVTAMQIFSKVEAKVADFLSKYPIDDPLFRGTLTEKQWFSLKNLQCLMHEEYKTRRETLLKRLDVTIQSFNWSDRLKDSCEAIDHEYSAFRNRLVAEPAVDISDLLAARGDLAVIEKTSNALVRKNTKSSVNQVLIGAVPDRGGRPEEQQPPPPEVPSWQKNEPQRSFGMGSGGRSDQNPQSRGQSRGGGSSYERGGSSGYQRGGSSGYQRGGGSGYQRGGGSGYQRGSGSGSGSSSGYEAGSSSSYETCSSFLENVSSSSLDNRVSDLHSSGGSSEHSSDNVLFEHERGSGGLVHNRGHSNAGYDRGGSRGARYGSQQGNAGGYDRGGRNPNYDRSGNNEYTHGMPRKENYRGGWNQGAVGSYSMNYAFPSQPPQYAQAGYMTANTIPFPQPYYSPGDAMTQEAVFGVGMGGYAATGGNFYQFGSAADSGPPVGRARGGRGGRGRGWRRGGPR